LQTFFDVAAIVLNFACVCARIETISWSPRAFVYHNFLSKEEVDHIVGIVEKLVRATAATNTIRSCKQQQPMQQQSMLLNGYSPEAGATNCSW
jgi:hypothetical protein